MKVTLKPYSDSKKPAYKFVVRYTEGGKARRKFFKSKQAAQIFKGQREDVITRGGHQAANLPPETLREVLDCLAKLEPHQATLTQAVDAFVSKAAATEELRAIDFEEAICQFMDKRRARNLRPRTLNNLESRIRQFATATKAATPGEVTKEQLESWIFEPGNIRSQVNRRLALSNFYTWAEKNGYAENHVKEIETPETDEPEPEILTVAQCRRLMDAAANHSRDGGTPGEWIPYHVLTLFAAIRPTEVTRLSWDDVCLESGTVTITGKAAKLRARRIVKLSANAVAWLAPHAVKGTPLHPAGSVKNLRKIRTAAKITPWPQDAPRHTCISAWLATEGEAQTATWAGNSPDICHRFYKGLMQEKAARAFFKITPGDKQVLKFEKTA